MHGRITGEGFGYAVLSKQHSACAQACIAHIYSAAVQIHIFKLIMTG